MKFILNKDKTKIVKVQNIEIEYIWIPKTENAKMYEEIKASLMSKQGFPVPEGLSYETDYCTGIRVVVNKSKNNDGENFGEYELTAGIQQLQINEFMEQLLNEEKIILPTQEEFGKIKGDF